MSDRDKEVLEQWREGLKESVDFFAAANKGAIERWACTMLLTNIGVRFRADEVLSQIDDPPDVLFRNARFEVKEILDPGRRRHDEYKDTLAKARAATDLDALHAAVTSNTFTPEAITPLQIGEVISINAAELVSKKYVEHQFRATLDLLFYVDLIHHTFQNGPMPSAEPFRSFGFRSISVLIGNNGLLFCAASDAPDFLRLKSGTVT